MNYTGLKFVLKNGAFIIAVVTKDEATTIIQNWMNSYYSLKDIKIIGNTNPPPNGWAWAVQLDEVQAVHTFTLEQMQQQLQQANKDKVPAY